MKKMPWEEGFNPDEENVDDVAPDPGAVSSDAMARLAELPAESDALSAGNTKTLDRVGDVSFPEADELAPKPAPRMPMSAPAPELPPVTPRPAFLDGAPGLDDDAPHVHKPLEASPEEYANETAPLGNAPKLTGDLSLKSQRVLGPKDLDQVGRPPSGPVDAPEDPIASGAKRDRMNQLMRAIELGGKQANAGLGGGPVGALVTEKSDFEGDARKEAATAATKAQAKAIDERNFAEKQRESDRTDEERKQRLVEAHAEGMRKKQAAERSQSEAARATALRDPSSAESVKAREVFALTHPDTAKKLKADGRWENIPGSSLPDAEKGFEFSSKQGDAEKQRTISNQLGGYNAESKRMMARATEGRFGQATAALGPLEGFETKDPSRPAMPDNMTADKVRSAYAAREQLHGHAEDAYSGMDELEQATPGTDRWIEAKNKVTNALTNMAAKLVVAEGRPVTEGSMAAMEATLGLHNGSFLNAESSWDKNAIRSRVQNAITSANTNFEKTIETQTNQRPRARPPAGQSGKVKVKNRQTGVESFISAEAAGVLEKSGKVTVVR